MVRRGRAKTLLFGLAMVCLCGSGVRADERVEENAIYGMYSGLSLTMDIYYPAESNDSGILMIPGSGWHNPGNGYGDEEVKAGYDYINEVRDELIRRGFTVFAANHRLAPRFRYPDAVDDVRRAVRFIRHHASRFSINATQLGALGHSSGGHLVSLLGVDDVIPEETEDPVEGKSSKVQVVAAIAAPYDMTVWEGSFGLATAVAFMGDRPPTEGFERESLRRGRYAEASPVTHVTFDDAVFLLIDGSDDPAVSPKQLPLMEKALRNAGVAVQAISVEGGSHSPELDHTLIADWFERFLVSERAP